MEEGIKASLQKAYTEVQKNNPPSKEAEELQEENEPDHLFTSLETGVDRDGLKAVAKKFSVIPEDLHLHPKLEHLIKEREKAVLESKSIDWGLAEFLAYGTLVEEGVPVRSVKIVEEGLSVIGMPCGSIKRLTGNIILFHI